MPRHEEYMLTAACWRDTSERYGPFNLEACSRDDGVNARLDRRFSPSNPFKHWVPSNGDRVFLNPPYSQVQYFLDLASEAVRKTGAQGVVVTAVIPEWLDKIDLEHWEYRERIPEGCIVFQHPEGQKTGPTRWGVLIVQCASNN